MANYVYKLELTDKAVDASHEHYFTSIKKLYKTPFAKLFIMAETSRNNPNIENRVITNRIKECRGVTGIIFEFESPYSYVMLRKIKPL